MLTHQITTEQKMSDASYSLLSEDIINYTYLIVKWDDQREEAIDSKRCGVLNPAISAADDLE